MRVTYFVETNNTQSDSHQASLHAFETQLSGTKKDFTQFINKNL